MQKAKRVIIRINPPFAHHNKSNALYFCCIFLTFVLQLHYKGGESYVSTYAKTDHP